MHSALKPTETNNSQIPRLALSPKEAAEALSISEKTLWSWTQEHSIPHVKLKGSNRVLYPVNQMRDWLTQNAIPKPAHDASGKSKL